MAVFQLVWLHRIISLVGAAPQGAGLALGGQFLWQPNVLMRAEIYCHAPSAEKLLMVLKALSKWQLQPEWQTVSKGMRCSGLQSWRSPGSRGCCKAVHHNDEWWSASREEGKTSKINLKEKRKVIQRVNDAPRNNHTDVSVCRDQHVWLYLQYDRRNRVSYTLC